MITPDESEETQEPFSYSERRNIAVTFARAYLGGQVKVKFPTATEYDAEWELVSLKLDVPPEMATKGSPVEVIARVRVTFDRNAQIILRTVEAKEEEYQAAVNWLVQHLWHLRDARRIDGEFLAVPDMEARVKKLEKEIATFGDTLKELRLLLNLALGGGTGATSSGTGH